MGAVKNWGLDEVDKLVDKYCAAGMNEVAAYDKAMREIFGENYDEIGDEPDAS